jgi:class 3 adenylate cyclase
MQNSALSSHEGSAIALNVMNIQEFCNKLENAEARSESVIAVFCDIRGFSNFSRDVESSDTSNFLKHFYLKLLREYFQEAAFAKPAGDGMLVIFRHNEKNLDEVSKLVLSNCFKVLKDFPKMFKSIPIINYPTPDAIGFGIARGSVSYLTSSDEILDYSGKLINLTARLNELARPIGIVIHGNYQKNAIPENLQNSFKKKPVYLRGIAEDEPIEVFYSDEVSIPAEALHPLIEYKWLLSEKELTVAEVLQLGGDFGLHLPEPPLSRGKIKVEFKWPSKVQGNYMWQECRSHDLQVDASGHCVRFPLEETKSIIKNYSLTPEAKFGFRCHYVPKPPPQEKKKRLQISKKA